MRRPGSVALLAVGGVALVAGARALSPLAPPLYDGITTPIEPYRYISPPPELAANNQTPAGGMATIKMTGGESENSTVQTDDKQSLAFFPKGSFKAAGPITVRISPDPSPPPPKSGSKQVGNAYRFEAFEGSEPPPSPAAGTAPPEAPQLQKPSQVLLRVPPVNLTGIRLFYDGEWHDVPWGAQTDYINITIDHLGWLAAFDDGGHGVPGPSPSKINWIGIIEAVLVVVAILIVVAAIIVQRRRDGTEPEPAREGANPRPRGRKPDRKRR